MLLAGLILPAVAATALDARPLAYIARVYATDESIKTAYAVFVNDLTGRKPRRITEAAEGFDSVAWVGNSRLVWRKSTAEGMELWTSASPYTKLTKIATAPEIRFAQAQAFMPNSGRPIFQIGDDKNLKWVDSASGNLVPAAVTKFSVSDMLDEPNPTNKPYEFQGKDASEYTVVMNLNPGATTGNATITAKKGETKTDLPFNGNLAHIVWDDKKGNVFLVGWEHNSTDGDIFSLSTFDWTNGKLRQICENASEFDFWPARTNFAYTTVKQLTQLGTSTKQVWTNEVWIGDWTQGTKHKILGGLAHYVSVAIRN